jgi:formylglycine-generating enzyme required for sulfatase activity/predicted Ser/Thr protein kinase
MADSQKTNPQAKTDGTTATRSTACPQRHPVSGPDRLLPKAFGRYRVEKVLGEGAMGVVYLARDSKLDRQVALKVPKFNDDFEKMERFLREARAAATLDHRNICSVYDMGDIDGVHYISMAYIAGRPLTALIDRSRPQSQRSVAMIVRKLALALETAHQAGIIHRDLKPANVILDQQNEPVITDFGLARQLSEDDTSRLTQSGSIMGSPAYMSPEQVNGDIDVIGPPSDIYSLGVFLYEFLTCEVPFDGPAVAVLGQILTQEPQKPSTFRADLDPKLEAICLKMMARQIDDRYRTMREAAATLSDFLKNRRRNTGHASLPSLPAAARDSQARRDTVESDVQRQTSSGRQLPTSQTVPGLRAAFQTSSAKFSHTLLRLPGWAKGAIGTVVVMLLVYCISLPFHADKAPAIENGDLDPPSPTESPFSADQAIAHQQVWAKHLDTKVEITNSIRMKMVLIPPGEFTMGSADTDNDAEDDEKPQHLVKITKPFYLGVYEVTQQQYATIMGVRPWQGKKDVKEAPDYPATYVSWHDALEFCGKLSEQEGVVYRLPYEAEWEYACRAGTATIFSYGNDTSKLEEYAWFRENADRANEKYGHRIGQNSPNRWGLFDMHGNVYEWCQDWRADYPQKDVVDPKGLERGTLRVRRSGSFGSSSTNVRSANRGGSSPSSRSGYNGFRVARTVR